MLWIELIDISLHKLVSETDQNITGFVLQLTRLLLDPYFVLDTILPELKIVFFEFRKTGFSYFGKWCIRVREEYMKSFWETEWQVISLKT